MASQAIPIRFQELLQVPLHFCVHMSFASSNIYLLRLLLLQLFTFDDFYTQWSFSFRLCKIVTVSVTTSHTLSLALLWILAHQYWGQPGIYWICYSDYGKRKVYLYQRTSSNSWWKGTDCYCRTGQSLKSNKKTHHSRFCNHESHSKYSGSERYAVTFSNGRDLTPFLCSFFHICDLLTKFGDDCVVLTLILLICSLSNSWTTDTDFQHCGTTKD